MHVIILQTKYIKTVLSLLRSLSFRIISFHFCLKLIFQSYNWFWKKSQIHMILFRLLYSRHWRLANSDFRNAVWTGSRRRTTIHKLTYLTLFHKMKTKILKLKIIHSHDFYIKISWRIRRTNSKYVCFVLIFNHLLPLVAKVKFKKEREISIKRERQKHAVCTDWLPSDYSSVI